LEHLFSKPAITASLAPPMNNVCSTTATIRCLPLYAIIWSCLFLGLFTTRASADMTPDPLAARAELEKLAVQMVTALQDPAVRQDVSRIQQLVDQILVPHIDFRASSHLVLGRHWKDASEAQRAAFIDEFQSFLVRFYTSALASYVDTGEVPMDVITFREAPRIKGERQVFVRSFIGQPDTEEIAIDYRMYWGNSWKVIDVSVDGISMVQSYRSSFNSTVKRKGLDELIAQLHERNGSFATN